MFGLGMPELLVILVIVVVLFGANKLPQIGAGIGKGIKNFKDASKEDQKDVLEDKKDNGSDKS
ncbi:MAG: twin-arginine translocase TatA/TatE family subunit [Desulfobulbaceae bacterium]|nr:twin-arginine translocase TatA/TatE family subunit [Desulfobulbaceae bacterium]